MAVLDEVDAELLKALRVIRGDGDKKSGKSSKISQAIVSAIQVQGRDSTDQNAELLSAVKEQNNLLENLTDVLSKRPQQVRAVQPAAIPQQQSRSVPQEEDVPSLCIFRSTRRHSSKMKLHILPPSANSHGCIAIIKHLKLDDVEIENAYGKTREPEFLAINPCHTCPTLELDGDNGAIWESCAIMRYLCVNNQGGEDLYPSDPTMRGKIDMVMDWRQTGLYPCLPDIGYLIFGMPCEDDAAKKGFAKLLDEHFPVLLDVYLKDTPFCFSDKPTIADLAIAPTLTFIKVRTNFWEAVPEGVKEYYTRVLEAFPDTKENFDMLDSMCTGYSGDGADLKP
mmetsp:Transcript_6735/g.7200  ORF Transcript_6735/g.7200 Transcript_6735/m.7200 type:complete len:338 (+) Transcript_6735:98-1111(+)